MQLWQPTSFGNGLRDTTAGFSNGYRRRRGRGSCHRHEKAVAAPGDGLDAAALRSPVIEDPAKRRDLHAQIAVLYHSRWPDGSDDLAPRHKIARTPDQDAENIERSRAERHRRENAVLVTPV